MRLQSSAATAAMFTTQGNSRSKLAPALQIIEIRTNSYRAERVYNSGEYMYYWYSSPWMRALYQAVDGKIYVSIANPEIILKVLLKCVIIMIKANLGGIIKMNKNRIAITLMTAAISMSLFSCENKKDNPSPDTSVESTSASKLTEQEEESVENTEADNSSGNSENPYGETADINEFIDSTDINPPLWKVSDPDSGNSIYLLGTIHMLPKDVSDYPSDLMDIYNSCDSIAVEYDVTTLTTDANAQMEYLNSMIYNDGSSIKDHISVETYNKAKEYFDSIGAYSEMLDQYTTGYWINQLQTVMLLRLENMNLSGTDTYFISKAQEDGKEIINIEELSMQTEALNAYSDDFADYNISEMVDNIDDINDFAESYSELYNMWSKGSGDIPIDMDSDLEELPDDLKDDYEAYVNIILDDRNQYMAEKASSYIKDGKNCLFMVGAAHYSGDNGVDNLLEEMGYTVEKIA